VTGNGTVSPQDALNYKMQARFSGTTVSQLSQSARLGGKGTTVPFFVQGTASDPKLFHRYISKYSKPEYKPLWSVAEVKSKLPSVAYSGGTQNTPGIIMMVGIINFLLLS
jgi:hypothetical protein